MAAAGIDESNAQGRIILLPKNSFQAAARLGDASDIIGSHPPALHLRYLQALTEIAAEKNSTTIFPVPMDLLDAFIKKVKS